MVYRIYLYDEKDYDKLGINEKPQIQGEIIY